MNQVERQLEMLIFLCRKRHDTYKHLAETFKVSERTVRRDISVLMCAYPIETIRGRYGGGVRVLDWYTYDRKMLTPQQSDFIDRTRLKLDARDLIIFDSIITQYVLN